MSGKRMAGSVTRGVGVVLKGAWQGVWQESGRSVAGSVVGSMAHKIGDAGAIAESYILILRLRETEKDIE